MEGDRILSAFKSSRYWELAYVDVQASLHPSTSSRLSEYELFSFKLLKQCVKELSNGPKCGVVVCVAELCVKSLDKCAGSTKRLQALAFEKLLLHLASGCLAVGNIKECVKTCEHVRSRLTSSLPVGLEKTKLLGITFKQLWCAADVASKRGGGGGGELMTLGIYEKALHCAVSSGMDVSQLVESCMKAEHCFKRLVASTATSSSSSHLQYLNNFHHSILPLSSLFSSATSCLPCVQFVIIFQYLLYRLTYTTKLGTVKDGCGLKKSLALLEQHNTYCDLTGHLILSPHVTILQVWASMLHSSGQSVDISVFQAIPQQLDSLSHLTPSPDPSHLMEALELILMASKHMPLPPILPSDFPLLESVILSAVSLVESCLDTILSPALEGRLRKKQLQLLSLLSTSLASLLIMEEEEIEVCRDGDVLPPPPTCPSKISLASYCLPLLQHSHDIINKGGAVLLAKEKWWLGNDAQKLAVVLARDKDYIHACPVMNFSCEALVSWCYQEKDDALVLGRVQESQLFNNFHYLTELYGKSHDLGAAVETLRRVLQIIPKELLVSMDTARLVAGIWVRIKLDAWTSNNVAPTLSSSVPCGSPSSSLIMEGSVSSVLPCERLTCEQQLVYLNFEQDHLLRKNYNHSPLVTVLCDLLKLYIKLDKPVLQARVRTQFAHISMHCTSSCRHQQLPGGCGPLEILEEGVEMLEDLVGVDHTPEREVWQELAEAYLWRVLLRTASSQQQQHTVSGDGRGAEGVTRIAIIDRVAAICLQPCEEQSLSDQTTIHTLRQCVAAWVKVWSNLQTASRPFAMEKLFHKPAEMLDCVLLTAVVCYAHLQTSLALKTLTVLLCLLEAADATSDHLNLNKPGTAVLSALAQALREEIRVSEGMGIVGDEELKAAAPMGGMSGVEGDSGGKLVLADLQWRLARARRLLVLGQGAECKEELLAVMGCLGIGMSNTTQQHGHGYCRKGLVVVAKAKLLSSHLLLLHSSPTSTTSHTPPSSQQAHPTLSLTPIELALDAVKLLWRIFDLKTSGDVQMGVAVSGVTPTGMNRVEAWFVLLSLLNSMKTVCDLHMLQGDMEKAFYYAREGAMLARTLQLAGWYRSFLLLLCEVFVLRADSATALVLSSQTSRLLQCSTLLSFLSPPTPETGCHANLDTVMIQGDKSTESSITSNMDISRQSKTSLNMDHHLPLEAHPATCKCDTCSNLLHICHKVKLIILACRTALLDDSNHVTDHVTSLMRTLSTADKQLTQQMKKLSISSQTKGKGRKRGVSRRGGGVDCVGVVDIMRAEVACARAKCQLLLWKPDAARCVVMEALERLEEGKCRPCTHHHLLRLSLARLHFLSGQALSQIINGKHKAIAERGVWLSHGRGEGETVKMCVDEFMYSYNLCFPVRPAILLREVCLWLSFLSSVPEDVHHYLSIAQQVSLTHQTNIVLGKKIRTVLEADATGGSGWRQLGSHVIDVQQALAPPDAPSSFPPSNPHLSSLLKARALLSSLTPPLTHDILSLLPPHWTILTFALSPKPHPFCHAQLIVTKATPMDTTKVKSRGRRTWQRRGTALSNPPVITAVVLGDGGEVGECVQGVCDVLQEATMCVGVQDRKMWWSARHRLDQKLQHVLIAFQDSTTRHYDACLPSGKEPVLMVLGRQLHQLPWESLPSLRDIPITRTPSLMFAAAHKIMAGIQEVGSVDVNSAYFVVNPQGDLKKTERLFGERFSRQEGWEGVVGTPPPTDALTTALQCKSLYVYCGHNAGHFLDNATLHALHMRAAALLIGCRSAGLKEEGLCDPSGNIFHYLMAGCPALVGCLWTVTDGDIDRFCDGLIDSLLSSSLQATSLLPNHVTAARSGCKLRWLVGASPVLYGLPVHSKP